LIQIIERLSQQLRKEKQEIQKDMEQLRAMAHPRAKATSPLRGARDTSPVNEK
jgi:hypothetical protein